MVTQARNLNDSPGESATSSRVRGPPSTQSQPSASAEDHDSLRATCAKKNEAAHLRLEPTCYRDTHRSLARKRHRTTRSVRLLGPGQATAQAHCCSLSAAIRQARRPRPSTGTDSETNGRCSHVNRETGRHHASTRDIHVGCV
eukprot:817825-Rhodomonas_salina.2